VTIPPGWWWTDLHVAQLMDRRQATQNYFVPGWLNELLDGHVAHVCDPDYFSSHFRLFLTSSDAALE
jgi:hypothetical protein